MNIKEIELKIAELKFRERDLLKELEAERGKYLYNAEKHEQTNNILQKLFVETLGIDKNYVHRYSQIGKTSGYDDIESVEDVVVNLYSENLNGTSLANDCRDITVKIRLTRGFEDEKVKRREREIIKKIIELRNETAGLQETKKSFKA